MMSTAPPTRPPESSLNYLLDREWLETDGLGGYASSTLAFLPTRRYHGLLIGRPEGSAKRHVFLSRFEEFASVGVEKLALSNAAYAESIAPEGYLALENFELVPWPRSAYDIAGGTLTREVQLVRGAPTLLVRYSLIGVDEVELELRPLLPFREADALTVENDVLDKSIKRSPTGISVQPYTMLPTLSISLGTTPYSFDTEPTWFHGLEYAEEIRRGYPGHEDQFSPGVFRLKLRDGDDFVLAVSLGTPVPSPATAWKRAVEHRQARTEELSLLPLTHAGDVRIARSADDFLYRDASFRTGITAGYPWFGEWGRDTFIALPGLTLARGDRATCEEVLSGALEYLDGGLLPNIYGPDREGSHYGSADASLWFARAVRLWEEDGGDRGKLLGEYLPALLEIAECYRAGTSLGIGGDESELIHMGTPELNPTWMDANSSTGAVTPRDGFPVEINALWYSLLAHIERLSAENGDEETAKLFGGRRRKAKRAFLKRFWLPKEQYLADVWKDGTADRSVRPNMVLAAALAESPLSRAQRRSVVTRAEAELLTPRGLRTLSPQDPAYRGIYSGDTDERDSAYHQGTVWPWLMGFYTEARLRAFGRSKKEREALGEWWDELATEIDHSGLDHLSEVFDGDAPHRPGGTIAQAWNSAEYLRARALLADAT